MRIIVSAVAFVALMAVSASAHTLFMNLNDNEDGTVTVEGMYSSGAVASKTEIRLESLDGKVLLKGRTDEDGEFEFDKPDQPYSVILDAGPGHVTSGDGPQ